MCVHLIGPPGLRCETSSYSRYLRVPETQVHHNNTNTGAAHNSYTGIMRSVGGPLVLVLVTLSCGDVTLNNEDTGTCTAEKSDCAGEFSYVWRVVSD